MAGHLETHNPLECMNGTTAGDGADALALDRLLEEGKTSLFVCCPGHIRGRDGCGSCLRVPVFRLRHFFSPLCGGVERGSFGLLGAFAHVQQVALEVLGSCSGVAY